ncbi:MAG: DUF4105 domain-containing protein, partial [bacterium]|nr:DUF4105 domain-containing protein [bacterium]
MQSVLLFAALFTLFSLLALYYFKRTPSHERNWTPDQNVLPAVSTYGNLVTIHDMRAARYRSADDYDTVYRNKTFKTEDIETLWLMIEPFGAWVPFGLLAAHTLLSFGLKDGTYVAISPEIRKKDGDYFSPWPGLARQYEFMYVLADEEDVIKLRTNFRKDIVRLYPLCVSKKTARCVFESIAKDVNVLYERPRFFHTAWHNCATTITKHLRAAGVALPLYHPLYVFPGTLDEVFHARGLIDATVPLNEAREKYFITEKAQ